MQMHSNFFKILFIILSIAGYAVIVFAVQLPDGTAPGSGGYAIDEFILNPGCGHGDTDCFKNVGGDVTWGDVTGTLSDQTDLQTELNAKQDDLGYTPADIALFNTDDFYVTSGTIALDYTNGQQASASQN